MSHVKRFGMLGAFALLFTVGHLAAGAEDGKDGIKTVFVIAMENHNWSPAPLEFSGVAVTVIFSVPRNLIYTYWFRKARRR
jgi:hypothetical protein